MASMESSTPKRLVLCFDGTGNKFSGNESDTNIVKIYEMLDRTDKDQYHYYQRKTPSVEVTSHSQALSDRNKMVAGIGTYVNNQISNSIHWRHFYQNQVKHRHEH